MKKLKIILTQGRRKGLKLTVQDNFKQKLLLQIPQFPSKFDLDGPIFQKFNGAFAPSAPPLHCPCDQNPVIHDQQYAGQSSDL